MDSAHGPAAIVSIAGTTAMAAFFGVIALRATGLGFLMITLALSQVLWGLAYRMSNVTNGDNGIAGLTRPMPFGISLDSAASFYWFALVVAAVAFLMMTIVRVVLVRLVAEGRARPAAPNGGARLQSLDDPLDHVHLCRLLGRRSGLLYVYYNKYIHPTSLSTTSSAEALLGVIAGGSGTLGRPGGRRGAGAVVEELRLGLCRALEHAAGLVFLFIVLVMPSGHRSRLAAG